MRALSALLLGVLSLTAPASALGDPVRVFVFAGQSNMVGADSHAEDIDRFPPFAGLAEPQKDVLFSYVMGREDKKRSEGWIAMGPVDGMVGPEITFAREVADRTGDRVAIIKVATGGTTLGGDWNPDAPERFELYPLMIETVKDSLAALDKKRIDYTLEALVWHQGENDMFVDEYRPAYGRNLLRFMECARRDLGKPELPVFVGELCTKTIWGMDMRPRMAEIAKGQRAATAADPRATYVPTSHVGVEVGNPVGLHYHYGTLGQLEHGMSHARAYLRSIGIEDEPRAALERWPLKDDKPVKLYVLAGHRNMEGERAFAADLAKVKKGKRLARDNDQVPFRYDVGAGVLASTDWEPLGPVGLHETFGPELSFGARLASASRDQIALAKFTDSGSQIVDWTPKGSDQAPARHVYPRFLAFVKESIASLEARGHRVELAGVVYHLGENDTSWGPFRRGAAERVGALVKQSRVDLGLPELRWILSQQLPTFGDEGLNKIDVVADVAAIAGADPHTTHVVHDDAPEEEERIVMRAASIVWLGTKLADEILRLEKTR